MLGKFKDKIFNVSNKSIYTFHSFSNSVKLSYEEKEVEGSKSKMYIKGASLQDLSITIDLIAELGVDVEAEIGDWKSYAESGIRDSLYVANKKYGGTWIVVGVSISDIYSNAKTILSATISVDFKEFAGQDNSKSKKVSNDKSMASTKLKEWLIINWEIGEKDQIIQNAHNLINIGMFEIPLNRQVGVSKEYLDRRKEEAELIILSEIDRNIDIYESRAKLKSCSLEESVLGDYKINVEIVRRD